MPKYRDDAVVLRTQLLGEADRIVILLGKNRGLIRAVAKGVRKTSSKFGARLEPLMVADLQFYEGRNLDIITQADTIYRFGADISADFTRYAAANVMAEVIEKLSEDDTSKNQYPLLLGALNSLAAGNSTPQLILNSYLLRAMSLSGWEPNLYECVVTGVPGLYDYFSIPLGGVVSSSTMSGSSRIGSTVVKHLTDLLAGNWDKLAESEQSVRNTAGGIIVAYVQHHLGRRIKSMMMLDQIVQGS